MKGEGVRGIEEDRLVDNAAWASGSWTAGVTSVGGILTAPQNAGVGMWIAGIVLAGLLSIVSSLVVGLAVAWFNHWLRNRESERVESGKDRSAPH